MTWALLSQLSHQQMLLSELQLYRAQVSCLLAGFAILLAFILGVIQLNISRRQQRLAERTYRVNTLDKSIKELEEWLTKQPLNKEEVEKELLANTTFLLELLKDSPLNKNPFSKHYINNIKKST